MRAESDVQVFDGVASIATGDVLLTLWQAPARRERIRRVTEWTQALTARTPGTIAACQFLLPTAAPPDPAAVLEAKRGFHAVEQRSRRLITVPLGDALWHDVVRTIIRTGVRVFGRAQLIKVASSADDAFALLGEVSTVHSPGRAELEAALEALYRGLQVMPPTAALREPARDVVRR